MKTLILIFSIFIFHFSLFIALQAQNLVPNPSFEEYTTCPDNYYMLPTDWYTCSGDPDYFNACDTTNSFGVPSNGFGYQQAAGGKGYCGFYAFAIYSTGWLYKEYLGCKLLKPLVIGNKYYITFKISFSGSPAIDMATNNIGLLFSTLSYQDYHPYDSIWGIPTNNFANVNCSTIISDSQNWATIKGSIIADSSYQYVLIGNFFDIAHTDTILLNNNYTYHKAYYFLDEVYVGTDSIESVNYFQNVKTDINLYPNPNNGNMQVAYEIPQNITGTFTIFDLLGKQLLSYPLYSGKNTLTITGADIDAGVYFYRATAGNKVIAKDKIVVIK